MARRKKVRRRKIGQKIFFLILLIVAVIIGYFVYDAYFKDGEKKEPEESLEEEKPNSEKEEEEVKEEAKTEIKKENGVEIIDEDDPNNSDFVTGRISGSGVKGDYFKIVVVTDQALSEGQCRLSLVGDQKYEESVEVVAHPNSSSCIFNLDKNKIEDGKYRAEVIVTTTGDRSGTIIGEVEK